MNTNSKSHTRADCKTEFLRKLHNMIELADLISSPPAIHWSPHGDGLIIRDTIQFYTHVLPVFFPNVNKQGSFTRKFNRNGIFKVLSGPEKNIWRHKDGKFYRGSHGLIGCPVSYQPTTQLTRSLGSTKLTPQPFSLIDEMFASTSSGPDTSMGSANQEVNEDVIDADLCDFFKNLRNSITDEMLAIVNHHNLALVRMDGKTVIAEILST